MWQFFGSNTDEKNFVIDGINVWAFNWRSIDDELAVVKDPIYGQVHNFSVYSVTNGEKTISFAAGEFSNGVWGFYVM